MHSHKLQTAQMWCNSSMMVLTTLITWQARAFLFSRLVNSGKMGGRLGRWYCAIRCVHAHFCMWLITVIRKPSTEEWKKACIKEEGELINPLLAQSCYEDKQAQYSSDTWLQCGGKNAKRKKERETNHCLCNTEVITCLMSSLPVFSQEPRGWTVSLPKEHPATVRTSGNCFKLSKRETINAASPSHPMKMWIHQNTNEPRQATDTDCVAATMWSRKKSGASACTLLWNRHYWV